MQIQIEHEITNDLMQKIFSMYDENFSPTVKIPHRKMKKRIKQKIYQVLSIKNENQEWIGFTLLYLNKQLKTIFIDYLCVDKKFQKGGIGRQILSYLNNKTQIYNNYDFTALECENYLIGYYEKNNYKKIPLSYPVQPLYMLLQPRNSSKDKKTIQQTNIYHKLIQFGLLFNGEIIICVCEFILWLCMYLFIQDKNMAKIILNFKSTHT